MRRIALVAVLGGVLLGGGIAGAHTKSYKSASSYGYPTSGVEFVVGDLTSSNTACEPRRRIKLFLERGGADRKVGMTHTNSTGFWEIHADLQKGKRYYMKASRKNLGPSGHRHTCKAYRSEALKFPSGTP